MTTLAPRDARSRQQATPIPLAPPVTTQTPSTVMISRNPGGLERGASARARPLAIGADPVDDEIQKAFAQTEREQKDHDPEHQAVMLRRAGDNVVENLQDHRSDDRAQKGLNAA